LPAQPTTQGLLTGIRKRRKHFLRKRRYADAFAEESLHSVANQLYACQETQVLAACTSCGHNWYVINRCRLRVCPLCSYEVAKKRGEFLKYLTKDMHHPKMMTLTMPLWREHPRDGINTLRDAFNKLRRTTLFKNVRGGAYQIELKDKAEGWHIHMHVLLDAPFLPYQRVFSEWRKIIGHHAPQVDVRAASSDKAKEYVCKYAAKSADFDTTPESIVRWYEATKGQRLFATFGEWYNVTIEDLDKETDFSYTVATCPACEKEQTIFLARDGPFVHGGKEWAEIKHAFLRGCPEMREIEGANAEITDPERPEERAARLAEKERCSEPLQERLGLTV